MKWRRPRQSGQGLRISGWGWVTDSEPPPPRAVTGVYSDYRRSLISGRRVWVSQPGGSPGGEVKEALKACRSQGSATLDYRGMEQRQLVGLIIRRSAVRLRLPLLGQRRTRALSQQRPRQSARTPQPVYRSKVARGFALPVVVRVRERGLRLRFAAREDFDRLSTAANALLSSV